MVAPEKMHFRYRLQGQDANWREVVNERKVQYSNLAPGRYRFRVTASNNSGVWNEQGASHELMIQYTRCGSEVPMIRGEPCIAFHAYQYALTGLPGPGEST